MNLVQWLKRGSKRNLKEEIEKMVIGKIVIVLNEIYDYIRMLDADGYPRSFIRFKNFELKFSKASLNENILNAKVEIIKNNEN